MLNLSGKVYMSPEAPSTAGFPWHEATSIITTPPGLDTGSLQRGWGRGGEGVIYC